MAQVWDNTENKFISQNKYKGREVKEEEFTDVLESFLYDGSRLLADHIPGLMHKLHSLAAIVSRLDGFRFYGCSLLFIYDGAKEIQDRYLAAKKTMTKRHGGQDPYLPTGKHHHHHHHHGQQKAQQGGGPVRRSHSADNSRSPEAEEDSIEADRRRGQVRIRVVDFAHPTTGRDFAEPILSEDTSHLGKGYDTEVDPTTGMPRARFPPKHAKDPDMGFLFGLHSICEAMRDIYEREFKRRKEAKERGESVQSLPALTSCPNEDVFDKLFPPEFDTGYLST